MFDVYGFDVDVLNYEAGQLQYSREEFLSPYSSFEVTESQQTTAFFLLSMV